MSQPLDNHVNIPRKSRKDSPSNSVTHSSSISSLGLVESRSRGNTHLSDDYGVDSSSSDSEHDDLPDRDITFIRNDTSQFDKSKLKKSFEDVFKTDSFTTPLYQHSSGTSDEEGTSNALPLTKSTTRRSPNVFFKKFISKSSLKPQPKSFKRITKELQQESQPLQTEINNEAAVTFALKDEEMLLEKHVFNNNNLVKNETLKKYELINRANKLWNRSNHHTNISPIDPKDSMDTDDRYDSNYDSHEHNNSNNNLIKFNHNDTIINNKKRKSIDVSNNEVIDQTSIKRRVVSTSPNLSGSTSPLIPISRRNSKLMQSTSDDLEKMSL